MYHYIEFQGPKDSEEQIRDLDLLLEKNGFWIPPFLVYIMGMARLSFFEKCARGCGKEVEKMALIIVPQMSNKL